jgi:hypothetical protein
MPPTGVWIPTVHTNAVLELSTDQVRSVPNSLRAYTGGLGETAEIARLLWNTTGNVVTTVSVAADVYPVLLHITRDVNLMCVAMGNAKACLSARMGDAGNFFLTITGLPAPSPQLVQCELLSVGFGNLWSVWSRIELTFSNNGDVIATTNGSSETCAGRIALSSGATRVQIGSEAANSAAEYGNAYYDNVVAYVRR